MPRFIIYYLLLALFLLAYHNAFADDDSRSEQQPPLPVESVVVGPTVEEKNALPSSDSSGKANTAIGFYHAFIASLSVIIVSELGDKTWFIAAVMAMRHSRLTIFAGAMAALVLMTILSACLGWITQLIPHKITFYISTALFALFGLKMLHEGYHMSPNEGQEEYEEAQAEVQKEELTLESSRFLEMEGGSSQNPNSYWRIISFVSTIFIKAFTLTFLAEWGDRSQLTTIILGARESVSGVILGAVLGHAICTGIAVVFGRLIAKQISVRTVTLIGGVVFILFALSALVLDVDKD